MVVTRSQGEEPAAQGADQGATEEAQDPTTRSGSQEATERTTTTDGFRPAEETPTCSSAENNGEHSSQRTVRPPKSRRSTNSRKKKELEVKQRLAELKIEQIRAEAEVQRLRLLQLQENSTSEDESGDDLASVRIGTWLQRDTEAPQTLVSQDNIGSTGDDHTKGKPSEKEVEKSDCKVNEKSRESASVKNPVIDVSTLAAALSQAMRSTREPPKYMQELPFFSGSSTDWLAFKTTYEESSIYFTKNENIARIRRSLRGIAKEAVECLLLSQPDPETIIKALERRFGRPEALIHAEMERLKTFHKLTDNARDLCVFAGKIANMVGTIEALKKPHYLHSPEMSRIIIEKLTPIIRNNWYNFSAKTNENIPELKKISMFLLEEADKCSSYALPEATPREENRGHGYRSQKTRRVEQTLSVNKKTAEDTCPQCKHDHRLFECKQFIALDTNARWEAAKKYNICYRCLQGKHRRITCKAPRCGKNSCPMKHHNLLHHDKPPGEYASTSEVTNDAITTSAAELTIAANPLSNKRKAYLKIAPVTLKGPRGSIDTFALLDEGSTITLIDETVANIIGADGPSKEIWIQGVNSDMKHTSKTVSLLIKGKYAEDEHEVTARTMERLRFTPDTVYEEHLSNCEHLIDIRDKVIYENASPKVLLGQDNWHLIVTRQLRTGHRDQPVASLTYLGWVLHGCNGATTATVSFCGKLQQHENNTIEGIVKNYFKLESLGIEPRKPRHDPEHQAMQILENTSRRLPDGRFETGLLWKNENVNIPNNYVEAERRLLTLERRLDRDEDLKQKYEERMENLFKSGYAEPAPTPPPTGKTWYLPHFPVINPAKPHKPPRLVHDAAAKSKGMCLNDMLHSGPDLLQSLPGVIMRFRQHPYAVSADIKEMFMQVKIRKEDRDALRFLWRGQQRTGQPNEYRMTSLIFGATSSPCTALYIKNRNARDYLETHPDAVQAIQKNHYMDDYLQSFPTVTAARDTTQTVNMIHKKAGFVLDGWTSNEKTILKGLSTPLDNSTTVTLGGQETEKTLGLLWHVNEDHLGFNASNLKISQEVKIRTRPPTKREALSVIMALFDPLGLISPITTPGKRIFQDTWRYKTEWDDPLPEELRERWNKWFTQLNEVEQLRIPRCYVQNKPSVISHQLHTFVDASEEAYAAAVYWRTTHADGVTTVSLAAAKSRVTPLKPVSIPRLELQAALLGARLAQTVLEEHEYEVTNKIYWCDSRTALTWIRSEPRVYKPFVAHRLAEIEESTKKNEWRWLPTRLNVADDATRATPEGFGVTHRWYTGPTFLQLPESEWPIEEKTIRYDTGEERETCHTSASQKTPSTSDILRIDKYSKWTRLIRTTARVLLFIALCRRNKIKAVAARKRTRKIEKQDLDWRNKRTIPIPKLKDNAVKQSRQCYLNIPSEYLIRAEQLCINASQRDSFASEIQRMTRGETNVRDNRLTYVSVYIDACGTLRVKGRISAAKAIGEDTSDPVVLDGKHPYTRLYIKHVHEKLHHGGTEITVNELRQRLWITKIRPAVKSEIKRCIFCRIRKAKPATPTTGNLPAARLAHNTRPFSFTGLDYFGPIEVTVARHREKRYGALFTCMTSRAIHLEVVHSLSADSTVSALRRFIARRGCPKEVWSDNATCFKAAEKELAEAARDALQQEVTSHHIAWRYIPPSAPFMGGAWERMVKAVKEALRVTMIEKHPNDETLLTLLTEVENIVNSRPLTHVSVDPRDPEALTPNHILIGPNCHVPPPGHFSADDVSTRQQWKRAQALADIFWRRWVKEYRPLLQHRRESSSSGVAPKVGDVVIICDSNLPRNTWPRGRVIRVYPGADGEVRVVDVITRGGNILRRPTRKIVVLPTEFADVTGSATAGECARRSTW